MKTYITFLILFSFTLSQSQTTSTDNLLNDDASNVKEHNQLRLTTDSSNNATPREHLIDVKLASQVEKMTNRQAPTKPRATARKQIIELKDGVLFVRLHTSSSKIDKLVELGAKNRANAAKTEINIENQSIIEAFSEYFNFCEVYFFYSNFTEEVKEGNYTNVFDAKLKPASISGPQYIYYSEYEKIRMDTDFNTRYKSIVIKDKNFRQLYVPFPLSKMFGFFNTEKYKRNGTFIHKIVEGLNVKLHTYYSKTMNRK